ncbi:alpha/beta fold hydrolase [Gordonia sp. SL306]|uniref:alpha/beta fold hydrolase n=1 Tax=Gordonia sp. SL306 TaxID=2995145 RepID=UPI00226E3E19|nr:alpha/beta hydrolase [Gordonia sp. SL306]WAC55485.1 alpha/beta hydrolase [Gordonia sp. SL306]
MREHTVRTDLGRLHATIVGEGPVTVLWHSMFVDGRSWQRVVPALAEHRTLVIVDGPSSGRSDRLDRSVDIAACADAAVELVTDLRAGFDQAAGVDESGVDWVGCAWGGHVGLHLAATRPSMVRSLVAISAPTFPIDAALRRQVGLLLPLYRVIGPRGPVRSAIETAVFTDATRAHDAEALGLLNDSLRTSGRSMIAAIRTGILNRTDLEWAALRTACPTLFVSTDDRGEWTPAEARAMASRMPDAHEVTVHGARVIPALEQPGATASAIIDFWSRSALTTDQRRM